MRILLLFLISLCQPWPSLGQERCSSDWITNRYIENNPNSPATLEWQNQALNLPTGGLPMGTLSIPVVVHVLFNDSIENIDDKQIIDQINRLNRDFGMENDDIERLPPAFQSLKADTEIEFCLATIDPQGRSTNGIKRVYTSIESFDVYTAPDRMKFTSLGGSDAWNSKLYLNIWVCRLNPGILGFSYPPGVPEDLDGVVIAFDYFGSMNTVTPPFHLGRTLTHEVGHYLGLKHIWGPAISCGDDFIEDTPLQALPNLGCPSFPNISSCQFEDNGPHGDLFYNFMDYVDDECMVMFTLGQKEYMRGVLASRRTTLLGSPACSSIGIEEANKYHLRCYPNPGQDRLQLEFAGPEIPTELLIVNLEGEIVLKKINLSRNQILSVEQLPPGYYLLRINGKSGIQTQAWLKL